jgi:hypothetical protein
MIPTEKKTCFKCGFSKPLTEFYKHTQMADGHLNKCKECTKADAGLHRKTNIDRIREYDRQRGLTQERKSRCLATVRKRRQEDRRYDRAHNAVARALKAGKIERQPCQMCGAGAGVHAHHDDYDLPLSVMWLCVVHHKTRHAFLNYVAQIPEAMP